MAKQSAKDVEWKAIKKSLMDATAEARQAEDWKALKSALSKWAWSEAERRLSGDGSETQSSEPDGDGLIDRSRFGNEKLSEPQMFDWAAQHMAVGDIKPEDAPNPRCWALLQFARKNPGEFWKLGVARPKPEEKKNRGLVDDGSPVSGILERIMEEAGEAIRTGTVKEYMNNARERTIDE